MLPFILLLATGSLFIVLSVVAHRHVELSSYTQEHGVRRDARVISEDAGGNPTLMVRLSRPVSGHDTTTVWVRGDRTYRPGASVTVVVDPLDPGHAELPGAPYWSSRQVYVLLVPGLLVILFDGYLVGRAVLRRRSGRPLRGFILR